MNEEPTPVSIIELLRSLRPVIGTKGDYLQQLETLLAQLAGLNCFDGDTKYMEEVKKVILSEIEKGAEKIGFFGSRAKGTQKPGRSDFDVVVVNRKVSMLFPKKGLTPVDVAGTINYWSSKTTDITPTPRIHINRYNKQDRDNLSLMKKVVWLWEKEPSRKP